MKYVYVINRGGYGGKDYLACDNYNDALKIAAGGKDEYEDEAAKKLVTKLPLLTTSMQRTLDIRDLETVVNMTIKTTLDVTERLSEGDANG
jgi:hypothetical protein